MMASSAGMGDIGQRVLIGVAAAAVVVMVVGYAFIAGNIAAPIGRDLGTVIVGDRPDVGAVQLADGRPAFVVTTEEAVFVVDARAPHAPGAPGRVVKWCILPPSGFFLDLLGGATFDADGRARSDIPQGLTIYPLTLTDEGTRVVVGSQGRDAGVAEGVRAALDCPSNEWVGHNPADGEVFDPSVAAAEEPPGWVWLEGRLLALDGSVALCDGLDGPCPTGASVTGIDPAQVPVPPLAGSFLGRVRDDAIVDLQFVPDGGHPR